jgi:hypothetical protein
MPLEAFFAPQRRDEENPEKQLLDQPFWIG